MEENKNLTAERSLEIIRDSIERSQRTISRNSALPLMWWGTLIVVFALLIAYLWSNHGGPAWNALWFFMWIVGAIGNRFIDKKKETVPTTFVGKTIGQVWATFGIIASLVGWAIFLAACGVIPVEWILPDKHAYINITSVICLCFGFASTITGFILKNRVFQVCGVVSGVGGYFVAMQCPGVEQMYVMAVVSVIGLIIPGLIIHFQNNK